MITILVEGIDKAGKSTFVEMLTENLRKQGKTVYVDHYGAPAKGISITKLQDQYLEGFYFAKEDMKVDYYILDRSFWGNQVYSRFYRQTKLPATNLYHLHDQMALNSEKIFYVLFTATPDVIHQRFLADNEQFTKSVHMPDIISIYNAQYQHIKQVYPDTRLIKVDTSDMALHNANLSAILNQF